MNDKPILPKKRKRGGVQGGEKERERGKKDKENRNINSYTSIKYVDT